MLNLIPRFIHDKYIERDFSGEFSAISMFVDIAGFTSITEELMKHGREGVEIISYLLNRLFTPVIDTVYHWGGFISGFAGDSFTAIFPDESPQNAVYTAYRIQEYLRREGVMETRLGEFEISVKTGLCYGSVEWGIVGGKSLKSYYFKGDAIKGCVSAMGDSDVGEVRLDGMREILPKDWRDDLIRDRPDEPVGEVDLTDIRREIVSMFVPKALLSRDIMGEFRDVVSVFISFEEGMDYEELNRFTSILLENTKRFRGYSGNLDFGDKGPSILILFGAPISYEDVVERSIDFISSLKMDLKQDIKAGVTYGKVYSGYLGSELRSTYTVLGDVVNLSVRLMMRTSPSEIYIDDGVKKNISDEIEIENLGELDIEGMRDGEAVYKILLEQFVAYKFFMGEIVGRGDELEKLERYVRRIDGGDFGGIVYIDGPPGIGKSRLINELREKLGREDYSWFYMPCDSILKRGLNPFIYFLKYFFNQTEGGSFAENYKNFEDKFNDIVGITEMDDIRGELIRTKSVLGGLINIYWEWSLFEDLDAKARYENALYTIKNLIKAESSVKPVVIILEDGQWIDKDSQEMLRVLMRSVEDFPFIIISSCRLRDDGSLFRFEIEDLEEMSILLDNLDEDNSRELMEVRLDGEITEGLFRLIFSKSEGNPLFTEQIILYMKENSLIEEVDGSYHLITSEFEIPEKINSIIMSRIDRLDEELIEVMKTASVLGRQFSIRVLQKMIGDREITDILDEGEREMIWSRMSDLHYIFKHVLIRDVIYSMQLKRVLRAQHKLAGEIIEKLYIDELKPHFAELAHHFEMAERYEKAKNYLKKAGDYAKERYRNEEALELYERLFKLLDDAEEQIEINMKIGEIYHLTGKWDFAEEAYVKIIENAKSIGEDLLTADAYRKLSLLKDNKGEYSNALEYINEALELYRSSGNDEGVYRSLSVLGQIYYSQGDYEKAMDSLNDALTKARKYDDEESESGILGDMGLIYQDKGDIESAKEYYERQLKIAEKLDDKVNIIRAYGNIGNILLMKRDYTRAMKNYEVCYERSTDIGDSRGIAYALGNMGIIFSYLGDYKRALISLKEQLDIAKEIGDTSTIAASNVNMGTIFYNTGDYERAMNSFGVMLSISEEQGDLSAVSFVSCSIGNVYKKLGEFEKADEYYDKAIGLGKQLEFNYYLCEYLYQKADLHYVLEKFDESSLINEEASSIANEIGRDELVTKCKIMSIKLEGEIDKELAKSKFKDIATKTSDDKFLAIIYYELSKLTGDDEDRKRAISLNEKLYGNIPDIIYKERIEELEGSP